MTLSPPVLASLMLAWSASFAMAAEPPAKAAAGRSVQSMQGLTANDPQGMAFGKMQVFARRLAGDADRKLPGWQAGYGAEVGEKDWLFADPSNARSIPMPACRSALARTCD